MSVLPMFPLGSVLLPGAVLTLQVFEPRYRALTKQEFHRLLLEANRQRLLELARADLVGAMDRQEVADSEIEDRGATYHFVRDPNWG